MALTPDIRDYLGDLARKLDATGHGERGALMAAAQEFLDWSPATIYRQLKAACGWTAGRKTRSDKGTTSVADDALQMLGAAQREGVRENGKQTLFTPTARSILEQNGINLGVSNGQLNRLIRARSLDVGSQRNVSLVQALRALYPNYLHQVDPSLCLVYYLKGKQHIMRDSEFYKNKLDNYAKVKLKVWRYVMYDRASGALVVWYCEAAGENQHSLFDFLMYAWGKTEGKLLHGVPLFMLWDKGSANTSSAIKNLLKHLEVEPLVHEAGNARAKGGVEGGNNIVETQFESRLRFEPVDDIAHLNAAAHAWAEAYNANLIAGQDTRLRRAGLAEPVARYDLWQLIRAEQLRLLPSVEVCRALMTSREVERTVGADMCISFKHVDAERSMQYDLRGLDGITVKSKVSVRALVYGDCAIQIEAPRYDGEMLTYRVEPIRGYDQFGQRLDAAVPGQEYKSLPETAIEKAAKVMDELAYPDQNAKQARSKQVTPFGGSLDAHSHLKQIEHPAYLQRQGTTIETPEHLRTDAPKLSAMQAMLRIAEAIGRNLTAQENTWLRNTFKEGVPEDQVSALIEQFTRPAAVAPATNTGGLRAV
ncbi:DDE-type integrase/transposase/recombinase [Pseudomonas anguilliseptica]|uniref:Integrase core domain-containing protein n=1 Tax=Pseudomonas anguilliseptica TaxID=53406 RepID=A0A1H5D614_PSEAG|nr:DDE-type integrase/transposase/recombinase [Pseudomonas anguilliseptica]SED74345.1 Integrase core domain-containing protein [Pseudomonas anguilliseptica]